MGQPTWIRVRIRARVYQLHMQYIGVREYFGWDLHPVLFSGSKGNDHRYQTSHV